MTFKELMQENGYETQTTFWEDFSIADKFGENAIRDTFQRTFSEWKSNHIYLTELVLVLNHKIWQHHNTNKTIGAVYNELWKLADLYAIENLQGEELSYFYQTTD